jgi:hypothetical protein
LVKRHNNGITRCRITGNDVFNRVGELVKAFIPPVLYIPKLSNGIEIVRIDFQQVVAAKSTVFH